MVHISQCKLVTLQTVYLTASPGAFDSKKRLQSERGSFSLSKLSLPSWRLSSPLALSPHISASRQLCDESRVVSLWQGHNTSALNLSLVKEYLNWQPLLNITAISYLVGRGESMVRNDQYRLERGKLIPEAREVAPWVKELILQVWRPKFDPKNPQ